MSKFKRFGDFITEKKDDLIDAKDGLAGEDYDGPLSIKPPQEPTEGKHDKPLPYKATGEEERGIAWTAPDDGTKKPLGQEATPGITPETSPIGKKVGDFSKPRPKPKKITTEEFIEKTQDMTDTEFMNYMTESHSTEISTITDLFGNEFTPDPQQSIEYVCSLMMGNEYYLQKFIREMKRRGGMECLMGELFQHGESYDLVVDHLDDSDHGQARAGKLAKMMNDRYMKAFDNFDFGIEESTAPSLDQMMPDMKGGSGGGDIWSREGGGNSIYAKNKDANPMGSAGAGRNPTGGGAPNFGGGALQAPMPPMMKKMKEGGGPKFKGNTAGLHLINELSNYDGFKRHMKDKCVGPDC
jgi:hypothetical protein